MPNFFLDLFLACAAFVNKKKINVGMRKQHLATVAANGHDGEVLRTFCIMRDDFRPQPQHDVVHQSGSLSHGGTAVNDAAEILANARQNARMQLPQFTVNRG